MHVHYLQHVPFEGPGSIAAWAQARNHRISATRLYTGDHPPPLDTIDWLVIMGGPMSVYDEAAHPWLVDEKRYVARAIETGKTVLGICLGAQLIADVAGARVYRNAQKEIGWFPVEKTAAARASVLGVALPEVVEAFHWHGETFDLPAGAAHLARSAACEHQAFACAERVVGLQFHLETTRAAAEELIRNCADELAGGPFVQSAAAMLADDRRFLKINSFMVRVLDGLAQVSR